MKKTMMFAAFAMAAIGFTACESNEEVTPYVDMRPSQEIPEIIKQLQEVNDSVASEFASTRAQKRTFADLVRADIKGAKEGVKWGGFAGNILGPFFNTSPDRGEETGGRIGGLIGGTAASILAYHCKDGDSDYIPSIDNIASAYCSLDEQESSEGSSTDNEEETLDLPVALDPIEYIGKYHNRILAKFLMLDNGIATCGGADETVPVDENLNPGMLLSEFETAVIFSDEYKCKFNQYMEAVATDITYEEPCAGIGDSILSLYMEALNNYSGNTDYSSVVTLTNQYISMIRATTEITENEKHNVYIALVVGVYSYKFWSDYTQDDSYEETAD